MIMKKYWLNKFIPLCASRLGHEAIKRGRQPFEDHSPRREPDFRSEYPAITSLCRPNFGLVCKLEKWDKIAYSTTQLNRLDYFAVAALEVLFIFRNHGEAADWYREKSECLPGNIIVEGNDPLDPQLAGRGRSCGGDWCLTEKTYKKRATKCGIVAICRHDHSPSLDIPMQCEPFMKQYDKGARNPVAIDENAYSKLVKLL
jgi:hypothetical protein